MRFCPGGKRSRLFMSHMNPLHLFLCANRVGDAVERIAGKPVNPLNSGFSKDVYQQLGDCFPCHCALPPSLIPPEIVLRSGFSRFSTSFCGSLFFGSLNRVERSSCSFLRRCPVGRKLWLLIRIT